MKQNAFTRLLDHYLKGTASQNEKAVVEAYLDELEKGAVKKRTPQEDEAIQARMLGHIQKGLQRPGNISMGLRWKLGAAAAVLVAIGAVWIFSSRHPRNVMGTDKSMALGDIKAPVLSRATLTLSDGKTMYLDSAVSGQLAREAGTALFKLDDGGIAYHAGGQTAGKVLYNTLFNPNGSRVIELLLSDGTRVWLNNGSSLKYPVSFAGVHQREVSVDGEAYFEVAHDAAHPFMVKKGETRVQVLGTHFNISAYSDEADIKVTLLEGAVKVSKGNFSGTLKPGQQARVTDKISVQEKPDADAVLSWKAGLFLLDNTDLPSILRQISRWYDVQVVYLAKVPDAKFGGGVSRNLPLSRVLKLLEANGLHLELDGKTLKVK